MTFPLGGQFINFFNLSKVISSTQWKHFLIPIATVLELFSLLKDHLLLPSAYNLTKHQTFQTFFRKKSNSTNIF